MTVAFTANQPGLKLKCLQSENTVGLRPRLSRRLRFLQFLDALCLSMIQSFGGL
jgi:hypothetical protein